MPQIPSGTKFIGISANVDTTERRSELINSNSEAYTIDDITASVSTTNPTSGVIPYNNGGVFADSGFSLEGPLGYEKTLLKHYDGYYGGVNLKLDVFNAEYSLGNATTNSSLSASTGIAMNGFAGEAIIGCNISSPTNGVFRASGANGAVWIGNGGINNGIGISNNGMLGDAMLVGSNLTLSIGPNLYLMVHIPGVGDKMILLQ